MTAISWAEVSLRFVSVSWSQSNARPVMIQLTISSDRLFKAVCVLYFDTVKLNSDKK